MRVITFALISLLLVACNSTDKDSNDQIKAQLTNAGNLPINRFAFGSCAKERLEQPVWYEIAAQRPDVFLFIGDNQYADYWEKDGKLQSAPVENVARIEQAYQQLAAKPGFAALRASTPILATWDDHDYGANDAGKEYPLKVESQQAFIDFFGFAPDHPIHNQQGVYNSKIIGPKGQRVQFILLDTRYHRDGLTKKPASQQYGRYAPNTDTRGSMLGEQQWRWLEQQLQVPAQIRVIASSIQVVAWQHGWESWGTMPHERQRLYDLIADTKAKGVFFLSGDRHLMEISVDKGQKGDKVPYPMWDFTSSGLNERERPVSEPNAFRLGAVARKTNFGVVDIDWQTPIERTQIRLFGLDDKGGFITEATILLGELGY